MSDFSSPGPGDETRRNYGGRDKVGGYPGGDHVQIQGGLGIVGGNRFVPGGPVIQNNKGVFNLDPKVPGPLDLVPSEALLATVLERLHGYSEMPKDHTRRTAARFAEMLIGMTTPEEFEFTTFPVADDDPKKEMIVLSPIPFYTLCAHHVVPFYGTAHIGYVPKTKIAGLSKFPRAVRYVAKGLWVQEELTAAIASYLGEHLENPLGVAVVLKAEHLCMAMRGVEQPGVITTTSVMRGVFADHDRLARAEFFELAGLR
jgi:GTP cyclohydrolase IA